jgi:AGZA family xanthine/uracil permease-like MFS transporter
MLGFVAGAVELLPLAVLAPIIVYVALDIAVQAFDATPRPHWPAVALAFLPAIAYLLMIKLGNPGIVPPDRFAALYADPAHGIPELAVTAMLGNGFIVTSMLWAAMLVALIDAKAARAAAWLALAAGFTAFGVIHSVRPAGGLYWPWGLGGDELAWMLQFAGAYLVLAVLLLALAPWMRRRFP